MINFVGIRFVVDFSVLLFNFLDIMRVSIATFRQVNLFNLEKLKLSMGEIIFFIVILFNPSLQLLHQIIDLIEFFQITFLKSQILLKQTRSEINQFFQKLFSIVISIIINDTSHIELTEFLIIENSYIFLNCMVFLN